ncbi:MAG: signal peptidase I, partial [Halobacteriovoraceae bacterium]|nr:signal peptidase I [Halobacteriovoraceae bacterium]
MSSDFQDSMDDLVEPEVQEFEEAVASPKKRIRFLRELLILIIIGFLVGVFRSVVFEPFKIPTGSMIPTLRIGDLILVNKFAYGFKVPFSDLTLFSMNLDPIYLFGKKDVKRGDVVVFKYPQDPS